MTLAQVRTARLCTLGTPFHVRRRSQSLRLATNRARPGVASCGTVLPARLVILWPAFPWRGTRSRPLRRPGAGETRTTDGASAAGHEAPPADHNAGRACREEAEDGP